MTSPLASLSKRKAEIAKSLHLDLPVPRWSEPRIIVRYRPMTGDEVDASLNAVATAKGGPKGRSAAGQRAIVRDLVSTCIGVYFDMGGETYTLDRDDPENLLPLDSNAEQPDWIRFDPTLGAALGVEEDSASAVCKAVFHTDGDLLGHHVQLTEWSGFTSRQVEEQFEGE